MVKTSVVIPVYNGGRYLQDNLSAVLDLGTDEVVVVDDASTDGSADLVAERFPRIRLLRHPKNARFPISVNDGFRAATGEVVFLLNQDVKPRPDLVKKTLPHFEDPLMFAVTFKEQDRSWADGGWIDGRLEFRNGSADGRVHPSLWASGGSAAFRKSLWNRLGGFDPVFTPGYYEDLDLGLRAAHAGYKIVWDPACRVEHVAEAAFKQAFSPGDLQVIKDRNYLLACWKNLPRGAVRPHVSFLIRRVVRHPGYVIPVLLAVARFPYVQKRCP